jgi:hypothetical protein
LDRPDTTNPAPTTSARASGNLRRSARIFAADPGRPAGWAGEEVAGVQPLLPSNS